MPKLSIGTPLHKSGRFFLLDASVEQVISAARTVLAGFALVAALLDPAQPTRFIGPAYTLMAVYFVLACLQSLILLLPRVNFAVVPPVVTHGADIAVISALLFLTDGPTSPFFAFFTFALLAAALRWEWRAVLATGACMVVIFLVIGLADTLDLISNDGPSYDLDRVIIRSAYLVVMSAMLAYVSAFRQRAEQRLARLASPPDLSRSPDPYSLEPLLEHAANILEVSQVIVAWEDNDRGPLRWISWRSGAYSETAALPEILALVGGTEEAEYGGVSLEAPGGEQTRQMEPREPELTEFAARTAHLGRNNSAFQGQLCKGEVFFFGPDLWGKERAALAEIITAQISLELDRQTYRTEAAVSAAVRERMRIGRDIHDSVLQSLAAASLQLKVLEKQDPAIANERLAGIRSLLTEIQQRIRSFIETSDYRADERQTFRVMEEIQLLASKMTQQWGCRIAVTILPEDAAVPKRLGKHLVMLLSEGIANSIRHGSAQSVSVHVMIEDEQIHIDIRDDGLGFSGINGDLDHDAISRHGVGPASLFGRVMDLGGTIGLSSSQSGTHLKMQLPLQ